MRKMENERTISYRWAVKIGLFALIVSGCGNSEVLPDAEVEPSPSLVLEVQNVASATFSPSATLEASDTPTASATATSEPSATPNYTELRGQVIPEKLSCRFGPGPVYLYKYGILATTRIEILGRMEHGDWVLVQAIGGDNPCWVKAELVDIDGDVMNLPPLDPHEALVWSPYYGALTGAAAVREGDEVNLSWHPLVLIAGDDSEQVPYVLESWLCQDGEVKFSALGVYYPEWKVIDEAGCTEESRMRVSGAEKHGYTVWSDFEWPLHE